MNHAEYIEFTNYATVFSTFGVTDEELKMANTLCDAADAFGNIALAKKEDDWDKLWQSTEPAVMPYVYNGELRWAVPVNPYFEPKDTRSERETTLDSINSRRAAKK